MWSLRAVSVVYLMSALWCALNVALSASFLGYEFSGFGEAEFFTVYGGLQMGIALAMLLSSFKEDFITAALFFSFILSSVLAGFRLLSMAMYSFNDAILAMAVLEILLAAVLLHSYLKESKQ